MTDEARLRAGVAALSLSLGEHQIEQLLGYLRLLQKWNQVYNLTSLRDPLQMVTHHVLDSLAVVAPLQRQLAGRAAARMLDVGSGAGLPGVVLAICCPGHGFECVDAVGKKAAFIQQVAATLAVPNLRGIHARVEALKGPYEVIMSRAFASLEDFVRVSGQALGPDGIWMGMKAREPSSELASLPAEIDVFHVEQLQVPMLDAERRIVWMRRSPAQVT